MTMMEPSAEATEVEATPTCCDKVRSSCAAWMNTPTAAAHVTLDHSQLLRFVQSDEIQSHTVEWDEEAWHYQPPSDWPAPIRKERMALYILALDAINFCFWPTAGYEYEDLASTLTGLCQADHDEQTANLDGVSTDYALTATKLKEMTVENMTTLFREHHVHASSGNDNNNMKHMVPPNMQQRCALWNEIGSVLLSEFDGSALRMIERANGSAVALVELLIAHFPGFQDYVVQENLNKDDDHEHVLQLQDLISSDGLYFLKRAQICVGDWNASLDLHLRDMDQLTTFADYRVPQLLRDLNILQYSPALAKTVDDTNELAVNSPEELSIRAATVTAVELLVQELNKKRQETKTTSETKPKPWTAVQTDWYLWQVGERLQAEGKLQPHHRVRTIYY